MLTRFFPSDHCEVGVAFSSAKGSVQLYDAPNANFIALATFANSQIHASLPSTGLLFDVLLNVDCSMLNQAIAVEPGIYVRKYINPLCGVSSASLGSMFFVNYRKSARDKGCDTADLLQRPGYEQVA